MRILQHASLVFLIIILYASIFPFNSTTSASSFATSEQLHANNEEASALLKWKSSLDKQSQSLLSSWEIISPNTSNHCRSWFGISCDKAGRVDNITINSYGLRELAYTMEVTEMQDVYSFGVLTLEVLMGRHPGDLVSQFSLSSKSPDEFKSTPLKDVLDPRLPMPRTIRESEDIACSLKLAFSCVQVDPRQRPTMKQVSTELSKKRPHQYSLFTMTLGNLFDSDDLAL